MTQIDKQLLLKDLCARLPYGVKCEIDDIDEPLELESIKFKGDYFIFGNGVYERYITEIKPYLRPMSSMTEKERTKLEELDAFSAELGGHIPTLDSFDYLNSIHVDYRGLIYKGLALEAPEGLYPIKI